MRHSVFTGAQLCRTGKVRRCRRAITGQPVSAAPVGVGFPAVAIALDGVGAGVSRARIGLIEA